MTKHPRRGGSVRSTAPQHKCKHSCIGLSTCRTSQYFTIPPVFLRDYLGVDLYPLCGQSRLWRPPGGWYPGFMLNGLPQRRNQLAITNNGGNGNVHHPDGKPPNGRNGTLLTVSQVADMLNAHPHSVRRWADMGLLPAYRIGIRGDRRFVLSDVDDFLAAGKNGPSGSLAGVAPEA